MCSSDLVYPHGQWGANGAPLRAGVSYARMTGVEHDVINPNAFEFVFVEIEMKARP